MAALRFLDQPRALDAHDFVCSGSRHGVSKSAMRTWSAPGDTKQSSWETDFLRWPSRPGQACNSRPAKQQSCNAWLHLAPMQTDLSLSCLGSSCAAWAVPNRRSSSKSSVIARKNVGIDSESEKRHAIHETSSCCIVIVLRISTAAI